MLIGWPKKGIDGVLRLFKAARSHLFPKVKVQNPKRKKRSLDKAKMKSKRREEEDAPSIHPKKEERRDSLLLVFTSKEPLLLSKPEEKL